jgi:mevalonate kinase
MDWNRGPVIAYATDAFRSYAKVRLKTGDEVSVRSYEPYNVEDRYGLKAPLPYLGRDLDYVRAVINAFRKMGYSLQGMDIELKTTIPVGTGLSSSAALCVSVTHAISVACGFKLGPVELANLAYVAEAKEIKTGCGQMDPHSSAQGSICYIDCSNEPPKRIERLELKKPFPIVIGDTGVPRKASRVLHWLGRKVREKDPDMLEGVGKIIGLVDEAWIELNKPDWSPQRIGGYMDENQRLLREYLRVSTFEIEELIYAALRSGAFGAKLTGAGGGGCIIAFTNPEDQSKVAKSIEEAGGKAYLTDIANQGDRIEDTKIFGDIRYPFGHL